MPEIPTTITVDKGTQWEAVKALVYGSTLSDHLTVSKDESTVTLEHRADDVPYELWGSGTQGLWQVLCSMASPNYQVSLWTVLRQTDAINTWMVGYAVATLCGVSGLREGVR